MQGTLTTENSRMAVKSRASIACISNLVCSFQHHTRRPRGKRLNRRKGPRRYAQQLPSSVHYFYIIIIEYTHINLPYQVHLLLRIFPLHLPSLETPQSTRLPPAHPRSSLMSTFPLVGSALHVYEQGNASSRVVKVHLPYPHSSPSCDIISFDQYGAEMVESSVKTIFRPVIDRLPVDVNQINEFACR